MSKQFLKQVLARKKYVRVKVNLAIKKKNKINK